MYVARINRIAKMVVHLLVIVFAFLFAISHSSSSSPVNPQVLKDLEHSSHNVDRILQYYAENPTSAYSKLEFLVDTFGHRISGSLPHARAVAWAIEEMDREGLENVHAEPVMVPKWTRGKEFARMTKPRVHDFHILGLGRSIGTNGSSLVAQIVVVRTFEELDALPKEVVQGKIVVFNHQCDWTANPIDCYEKTVEYRYAGAIYTAMAGGIACLVKTVGAFSIASPHTGGMGYKDSVKKVPAAALAIEEAEMLQRMFDRGMDIEVELYMEAQNYPDVPSYNVVGEIVGHTYPDEVVLVSGHMDSWDVGQGAMDDGGGAVISWEVLSTMKKLGIRAKRTIRFVGWACEEFGGIGAQQYYTAHKSNLSDFSLVMESDLGVFQAEGIQFSGSKSATAIMQEVVRYLKPIGADQLFGDGEGTDISPWEDAGVPGVSLANRNEKYFWYHHSHGDMLTVLDPKEMSSAAATWAATAFMVADLTDKLPRDASSLQ
jgi:carboxypeptidase Q